MKSADTTLGRLVVHKGRYESRMLRGVDGSASIETLAGVEVSPSTKENKKETLMANAIFKCLDCRDKELFTSSEANDHRKETGHNSFKMIKEEEGMRRPLVFLGGKEGKLNRDTPEWFKDWYASEFIPVQIKVNALLMIAFAILTGVMVNLFSK